MTAPSYEQMQGMFRAHTEAALKVIVEIMTTGTGAKGESVRLAAAKEILSRGWGRPPSYKDMDRDKDEEAKPARRPEWRSPDGKTYAQLYAEKAAEVAAEEAEAAKRAATPEPPVTAPPSASAPPASAPPASVPSARPARDPDPTGYIARRALVSGPAPKPPAASAP